MTELRIIQWEDYPDSPDGLNVVTLLRCHRTEWRWCWDRMSTGPSYYWEPPLVAGGSSLTQCLNFWTGGIELTSHRFLGRISGPPCLWAAQDPMNQARHCFCAISCFPGSALPDIQSFPKRTTHPWMWLSQEILHVLPASFCCRRWTIWQGDNDWVGSQESGTGSDLHSTARIDYKNTRSYWEKYRGNTEAILALLAAGNERQWCIGTAFETLLKSKQGKWRDASCLSWLGWLFSETNWCIVSPSVDTQVLHLPAVSHQILKCTPFCLVLVRMAHNCTFIRK